jgi:hypothetical protein
MGGNCCAGPRVAPPDSTQAETHSGRFAALSKDITQLELSAAALLSDIKSLAAKLHVQLEEIRGISAEAEIGNEREKEKEKERRELARKLEERWEGVVGETKGAIVGFLGKTELLDTSAQVLRTKVSKKQASKQGSEAYKEHLAILSRSLETSQRNVLTAQMLLNALSGPRDSLDPATVSTTLSKLLGKEEERGSMRLSVGNRNTATSLQDSGEVYIEEIRFGGYGEVNLGSMQGEDRYRDKEQIVEMLDDFGHISTMDTMQDAEGRWNQQAEYQELLQSSLLARVYSQCQQKNPRLLSRKEVTATFHKLAKAILTSDRSSEALSRYIDLFVLDFFLSNSSSGLDSLLSFLEGLKASVAEHRAESDIQAQVLGLFTHRPLPRAIAGTVLHLIALADQLMELEANHLEMALRRAKPVPVSAQAGWMPLDSAFALAYRVFAPDFVEEGSEFVENIQPGQVSKAEYARFCILFYLHSTHQDGNSFFQSLCKGDRKATYPSFIAGLQDTLVSSQGARELFELLEGTEQEGVSRPVFLNAFNLNRYHSMKELLVFRVSRQMLFDKLIQACMDARRRTIVLLGERYIRAKGKEEGLTAGEMTALLAEIGSTLDAEETVKRYLQEYPKTYMKLSDLVRIAEAYGGLSQSIPSIGLDSKAAADFGQYIPTPAVKSLLVKLQTSK